MQFAENRCQLLFTLARTETFFCLNNQVGQNAKGKIPNALTAKKQERAESEENNCRNRNDVFHSTSKLKFLFQAVKPSVCLFYRFFQSGNP